MLIKAPSKINLTLKVLSKRADGYHEISSYMRAIRLFDELEVGLDVNSARTVDPLRFTGARPKDVSQVSDSENRGLGVADAERAKRAEANANLRGFSGREPQHASISITTNTLDIPKGAKNLAWQAADLAVKELSGGFLSGRIEIDILKNIPIAAGLGGGSSDAAAVLLWAAKTFAPETKISELTTLGAKLGADVPFCIYACAAANPSLGFEGTGSAVAEGIGEKLTPVQEAEKAYVILVKPDIKINTKEVYALYDEFAGQVMGTGCDTEKLNLATGNDLKVACEKEHPKKGSESYNPASENDLEYPCMKHWPIVGETIAGLKRLCEAEEAGKAKVQMTGSGPTVFAYFGEDDFGSRIDAQAAAKRVYKNIKEKVKNTDSFVHLTETL